MLDHSRGTVAKVVIIFGGIDRSTFLKVDIIRMQNWYVIVQCNGTEFTCKVVVDSVFVYF